MTLAVVDASAVLALILGEPGAERVKSLIDDCAITTVNLAEVVGYFARKGAGPGDIEGLVDGLQFDIMPFDRALAYAAGLLLPSTGVAGLSLGDRACLALAARLRVRAITTDRSWSRIAQAIGVEVELIR